MGHVINSVTDGVPLLTSYNSPLFHPIRNLTHFGFSPFANRKTDIYVFRENVLGNEQTEINRRAMSIITAKGIMYQDELEVGIQTQSSERSIVYTNYEAYEDCSGRVALPRVQSERRHFRTVDMPFTRTFFGAGEDRFVSPLVYILMDDIRRLSPLILIF